MLNKEVDKKYLLKLKDLCYEKLIELDENDFIKKNELKKRLDFELEAIENTTTASKYIIARDVLKNAGLTARDVCIRGCGSGLLVSYLIGISDYNPVDYDIKAEMAFGMGMDKNYSLCFSVLKKDIVALEEACNSLSYVEKIYRGYRNSSDSPYIEVHPGAYFFVLTGDDDIDEEAVIEIDDKKCLLTHVAEGYFPRIDFVPVDVLGDNYDDTEFGKYLSEILKPTSYLEKCKVMLLQRSSGVWNPFVEESVMDGSIDITNIISSIDDVYDLCIENGINEKYAYRIAYEIKRGAGHKLDGKWWDECKDILIKGGVNQEIIESLNFVEYLYPRAQAISYLKNREEKMLTIVN